MCTLANVGARVEGVTLGSLFGSVVANDVIFEW